MLVRLAWSFVLLQSKRAKAIPITGRRGEHLERVLRNAGLARPVRLFASTWTATPIALGPYRPSIMFPVELLEAMNDDELGQLALHEAAHLLRRDDYTVIVQRLIQAVFALRPVMLVLSEATGIPMYVLSSTDSDAFVNQATARQYSAIKSSEPTLSTGMRLLTGLRNSYVLGFRSSNAQNDGSFRRIEVQYVPLRGISQLNYLYPSGYYPR